MLAEESNASFSFASDGTEQVGETFSSILLTKIDQNENRLKSIYTDLKGEIHSIALSQHVLNERLPKVLDVYITPSEYKKSEHKETFLEIMEILGLGRESMALKIKNFEGHIPAQSENFDFTFRWKKGQAEKDSYIPLVEHISTKCHLEAVVVGDGQSLPSGLLYHQEIWTLKRNLSISSADLRKTSEESLLKYVIQGRTDIVRIWDSTVALGRRNNRYFIAIKRTEDFAVEDSLREACLQLIGGNVANTFQSPPVLLTNLANSHFVLYISQVGDPMENLAFHLHVIKMPSFGTALAYVEEHTASRRSVTMHFGRRPTPPTSPLKPDISDVTEVFGNVLLKEV